MADFPSIPFFTDAYIADTQHLTNEEHGVYLRLLMFAWRTPGCCLPDDDRRLAIMVGVTPGKWSKLKPVVMGFWQTDGTVWRQKRLTKERSFASKSREQKRAAGKASYEAKSLKTLDTTPTAVATEDPTAGQRDGQQPIPIPIQEDSEPIGSDGDAVDFHREALWKNGVQFLCGEGVPENQARSLIGKWIKQANNDARRVFDALAAAKSSGTGDPVPYITEVLKSDQSPKSVSEIMDDLRKAGRI